MAVVNGRDLAPLNLLEGMQKVVQKREHFGCPLGRFDRGLLCSDCFFAVREASCPTPSVDGAAETRMWKLDGFPESAKSHLRCAASLFSSEDFPPRPRLLGGRDPRLNINIKFNQMCMIFASFPVLDDDFLKGKEIKPV